MLFAATLLLQGLTIAGGLLLTEPITHEDDTGKAKSHWEHRSSDLPENPNIHFGALDNGIRYAWMSNPEPDQRSFLYLHVNTGSLAEEESERGMAHLLEHLAFGGSENFEPGTMIDWLKERGLEFGPHTNAYTGFSETVYLLHLPTSDEQMIRDGLTVMGDFADRLFLSHEEVRAEIGVIDGEERERDSAGARAMEEVLTSMLGDTRIPTRMPIGKEEVRHQFTGDSVRSFYERWYRPENMTLVLVGDLEDLDPVPLFHEALDSIEQPETPVEPEPAVGKPSFENRYIVVEEQEIPIVQIGLSSMAPPREGVLSVQDAEDDFRLSFALNILDQRLARKVLNGSAPYLQAQTSSEDLLGAADDVSLNVVSGPENWEESLAAGEQELRRALLFGFQQSEVDEIRTEVLHQLDLSVETEATKPSDAYAQELLEAAEMGLTPMTSAAQRDLFAPLAVSMTPEECHKALTDRWNRGESVLVAIGNLTLGEDGPKRLREAYENSREVKLTPPETMTVSAFAYGSDPEKKGSVASQDHIEKPGVDVLTLGNGVELLLLPTDFDAGTVYLRAVLGEGELTLEPEKQSLSMVANSIFGLCGLEAHDVDELQRLLAGRSAGISFSSNTTDFSFQGTTTAEDLLLELELLCAFIEHPGWRPEGERLLHLNLPRSFEALSRSHEWPFVNLFFPALYHDDARFSYPTLDHLLAIRTEEIRGWLEPHFASAPLSVCLVGDFESEDAIEALLQTVGNLGPRRARDPYEERRIVPTMVTGIEQTHQVDTQIESSLVRVVLPTTDGRNTGTRRDLEVLTRILQSRIMQKAREEMGAAYSPNASSTASRAFPGMGRISITVMSSPDRTDAVRSAILEVIEKMGAKGVTEEEVTQTVEPLLGTARDGLRSNSTWLAILSSLGDHPGGIDDAYLAQQHYSEVTPERISALAKRYLAGGNASVLVVNPAGSSKANTTSDPENKR